MADVFKALADPTRRLILDELAAPMRIHLTSVFVDDQRAALDFCSGVLGFEVRHDIPLGEDAWWPYRAALVEDGIPLAQFAVADVRAEHGRLTSLGVVFTQPPSDLGEATVAVFDDTCGNLIQIADRAGA
jgi:catechol 2,3-dioxygenase-like lactoylglutathione lyase family enzyme